MNQTNQILLIGKDSRVNSLVRASIQSHPDWKNHKIEIIESLPRKMTHLSLEDFSILIADTESFDESPLEILIQLRNFSNRTPLIILNQPGQEKTAINCLKHGADYYIIKEKNWTDELPDVMTSVAAECEQKIAAKRKIASLEEENRHLKKKVITDPQTHLYSAEHFQSILDRELKRSARHNIPLSCIVMNVDDKKSPNTNLKVNYEALSLLIKSIMRGSDIWSRLDSSRFAAILPHTDHKEAKKAVKRIESEIKSIQLDQSSKKPVFQFKWGIAPFNKDKINSAEELLGLAEANIS